MIGETFGVLESAAAAMSLRQRAWASLPGLRAGARVRGPLGRGHSLRRSARLRGPAFRRKRATCTASPLGRPSISRRTRRACLPRCSPSSVGSIRPRGPPRPPDWSASVFPISVAGPPARDRGFRAGPRPLALPANQGILHLATPSAPPTRSLGLTRRSGWSQAPLRSSTAARFSSCLHCAAGRMSQ